MSAYEYHWWFRTAFLFMLIILRLWVYCLCLGHLTASKHKYTIYIYINNKFSNLMQCCIVLYIQSFMPEKSFKWHRKLTIILRLDLPWTALGLGFVSRQHELAAATPRLSTPCNMASSRQNNKGFHTCCRVAFQAQWTSGREGGRGTWCHDTLRGQDTRGQERKVSTKP